MADNKSTGKKRLVKNPETFRERASKAAEAELKPSRTSQATSDVKKAGKAAGRPVGAAFSKLIDMPLLSWTKRPAKIIGLIIFPRYLRNSWQELRLVTWPNWTQSRQLTFAVLIFAIVFGSTVAIVDYGLDKLFRHLLIK